MTPRQTVLLFAAALFWGSSYPFISLALGSFPPSAVVFWRCAMAAVALLGVILLGAGRARAALPDFVRRPGPALLLAVTTIAAPFSLIAFAQQRVPGGLTGVLVATTPIFVALLALRFDPGERLGVRRAAGLAVGLAGVGLVVGAGTVETLGQFLSALLILLAAAFFASGAFVTKRFYGGVPAVARAFAALAVTAALTSVPAWVAPSAGSLSGGTLAGVLLLGFGSTACGMLAYFTLIDEVGAGRAALVTYLGPGFSVVLAALILGEPVTAAAVAGLALILGGVAVASRADRPGAVPASLPCGEGLSTGHPAPPEGEKGPER